MGLLRQISYTSPGQKGWGLSLVIWKRAWGHRVKPPKREQNRGRVGVQERTQWWHDREQGPINMLFAYTDTQGVIGNPGAPLHSHHGWTYWRWGKGPPLKRCGRRVGVGASPSVNSWGLFFAFTPELGNWPYLSLNNNFFEVDNNVHWIWVHLVKQFRVK